MKKRISYHLGLDVGSTTVKAVLIDSDHKILFSEYERHHTDARATFIALVKKAMKDFKGADLTVAVTGSGGIEVAKLLDIPFLQEVIACSESIQTFLPKTDVAIELGGEDAKLTFFQGTIDQRMNETCAGGTGAFIDQMAVSLQTDASGVNNLAENHSMLYPIAARCGVFAKTDVTVLLNEGAKREDVAASIFQAVVDQTIGGLACGNKIRGNVAFLGGPLHFLPALKQRFIETLKLPPEQVFAPDNAHFFVALGCALLSKQQKPIAKEELLEKINSLGKGPATAKKYPIPALFESEKDYKAFKERHDKVKIPSKPLKEGVKDVYLGIDAGSTTTKAVLMDKDASILRTWYGPNKGNPLMTVKTLLEELYAELPTSATIRRACITGYGEAMLRTAFGIDDGEVETLVHCKAASYFVKDVSFILDIGGQDMKCIYLKKGQVDKIILNEACSSGCGSFIETFAHSLGLNIQDFAKAALQSEHPIDLGSRCTVFMNSKVKQAQKEGASVADISAGLSYSVAKNALYKVIKIGSPEELGPKVVVQGGTFFNDAVLRAFENLIGRNAIRPTIAGLMGAFGAALLAKENSDSKTKSTLISKEDLKTFTVSSDNRRCSGCSNRCLLTINRFANGKVFISGNKCDKGGGKEAQANKKTDLYHLKYKRLFDYYKPLEKEQAPLGDIGIPRVLNMYEDYPLWFTLFTELGFRVVLSDPSSKTLFNKGLDTIPSQTACYPAKMVHGHIVNLIEGKGVKRIFYPAVPTARKEFKDSHNCYNCPVVGSYPELIRLNMDVIGETKTEFLSPFLPIDDERKLAKRLLKIFAGDKIPPKKMQAAVSKAFKAYFDFQKDIRKMGEDLLSDLVKTGEKGIVLAGRPYHLDPEINHGISTIISGSGVSVFTEDSIAHLGKDLLFPLTAIDQWTYHSRLYRAATLVAKTQNLQMVQLNSFGCGLDAVTSEQVEKILSSVGKPHTLIKIDEGTFLGAIKIRIRSLLSMMAKADPGFGPISIIRPTEPPKLTKDNAKDYTILCPQMAPIHFALLQESFKPFGYNIEVLPNVDKQSVEEGLRYVNNDACYPAITVVGQLIQALKTGKYDLNKTAVIISQTGGGCRATNYVTFLKDAVRKAGFANVPVLAFNMNDMTSKDSPFEVSTRMYLNLLYSFLLGDLISRVSLRMRPYELTKGMTDEKVDKWIKKSKDIFVRKAKFKDIVKDIVRDFDRIPINEKLKKPRVGIVGEILVKFHPGANNQLIDVIEHEGGEAVLPDLMDFALYCLTDKIYRHRYLSGKFWPTVVSHLTLWYVEKIRNVMRRALKSSKHFTPLETIFSLKRMINDIVSPCNQTGEGWLLTAEMIELIHAGAPNIVCVQPFACLPNHITGKGVMKELKRRYPEANIAAIDYDPGASEVNQLNRIKLMMSVALRGQKAEDDKEQNKK